jgi:transcriptional regulator with XRE-family HTH domain
MSVETLLRKLAEPETPAEQSRRDFADLCRRADNDPRLRQRIDAAADLVEAEELLDSQSPAAVPITAEVLDWALDESGLTPEALAEELGEPATLVAAWRRGEAVPTAKEFRALAKALHRPEAFFFLSRPPQQHDVPAAFHSAVRAQSGRSFTSRDVAAVRAARRAQQVSTWLVDRGRRPAATLLRVNAFDPVDTAGRGLRRWLGREGSPGSMGVGVNLARSTRADLENRGLMVLHMPMGGDEWRGFSLQSPATPVIVVNTRYNDRSRVFTYLHELVHLSAGTESICAVYANEDLERWCDQVASAALMPVDEVRDFVRDTMRLRKVDTLDDVRRVAGAFTASLRAAAVRLEHLGLAGPALCDLVDSKSRVEEVHVGGRGAPRSTPRVRLQTLGCGYLVPLLEAEADHVLTRIDMMELLDVTSSQLEELRGLVAESAPTEE